MKLTEIKIGDFYTYSRSYGHHPRLKAVGLGVVPGRRTLGTQARSVKLTDEQGSTYWVRATQLQPWPNWHDTDQARRAAEQRIENALTRIRAAMRALDIPGRAWSTSSGVDIKLSLEDAEKYADWLEVHR